MVAAALDEPIDPEDPLLALEVDCWIPFFAEGIDTASTAQDQLAPDGLPIWE